MPVPTWVDGGEKEHTMRAPVTRTLFIGVGGLGQLMAAAVKRRFLEAYGQVPPMVGFLVLDTAQPHDSKVFDPSEFQCIGFNGAAEFADQNRELLAPWFDYDTIPRSTVLNLTQGSGQIPQIGRLPLLFQMHRILDLVSQRVRDLYGADFFGGQAWQVAQVQPQVLMFGSIAGGTASGVLLDLACALRRVTRAQGGITPVDWRHEGFLAMPEIFRGLPCTQHIQQNGYAFLRQLDFMLSERQGIVSGRYGDLFDVTSWGGVNYQMVDPFDSVTLFGATAADGSGDCYCRTPGELADAMAEVMYASTAEPRHARRVFPPPNWGRPWQGGKQCWYSAAGVGVLRFPRAAYTSWAEVVFAQRLISALHAQEGVGKDISPDDFVSSFLLDNHLRELGRQDNEIVDAILPLPTMHSMVPAAGAITGSAELESVLGERAAALEAASAEALAAADGRLAALLDRASGALEARLDDIVRTSGVATAASFLSQLRGYFQDVRGEMDEEAAEAGSEVRRYEAGVAHCEIACSEALERFFGRRSAVEKALDQHRAMLAGLTRARLESLRSSRASQFCVSMDTLLSDHLRKLELRGGSLADLEMLAAAKAHEAAVRLEADGGVSVVSVYPEAAQLHLPVPDVAAFYAWYEVHKDEPVTGLWTKPAGETWRVLLEFAREHDVARVVNEVDLVSTLAAAGEEQRESCFTRADARSQPLLQIDRGHVVGRQPADMPSLFYEIVGDDDFFAVSGQQTPLLSRVAGGAQDREEGAWSDRDSASFVRHWGSVPAYALATFPWMREAYLRHRADPANWCPLLDKRWERVLPGLDPSALDDDDRWVWTLAASDIDYLRQVTCSADGLYILSRGRARPGDVTVVEEVNLGQGLAQAVDTFLADGDHVEQCRKHIEAAVTAKGMETIVDDLEAYRERLKVSLAAADESRRPLIEQDVVALESFLAQL